MTTDYCNKTEMTATYWALSHGGDRDVALLNSWRRAGASSARIWRTSLVKSSGNCGLTSTRDISHIWLTDCSMSRTDSSIWSALIVWSNSRLLRTFCEPVATTKHNLYVYNEQDVNAIILKGLSVNTIVPYHIHKRSNLISTSAGCVIDLPWTDSCGHLGLLKTSIGVPVLFYHTQTLWH